MHASHVPCLPLGAGLRRYTVIQGEPEPDNNDNNDDDEFNEAGGLSPNVIVPEVHTGASMRSGQ